MKRKIKFRVWDAHLTRLLYLENDCMWDTNWMNTSFCMQSTGIEDKNGIEIFEGDIVSFKRGIGNWTGKTMTTTHIVAWDEAVARFSLGTEKESIKFRSHPRYEYEVIGNIYENPELVNEAT